MYSKTLYGNQLVVIQTSLRKQPPEISAKAQAGSLVFQKDVISMAHFRPLLQNNFIIPPRKDSQLIEIESDTYSVKLKHSRTEI